MPSKEQSKKRKLSGLVVNNKMDKTVVVSVERVKKLPKIKKIIKVTRKVKAHDEKNQYKAGDKVILVETRPLSKDKRWRVAYGSGDAKK